MSKKAFLMLKHTNLGYTNQKDVQLVARTRSVKNTVQPKINHSFYLEGFLLSQDSLLFFIYGAAMVKERETNKLHKFGIAWKAIL